MAKKENPKKTAAKPANKKDDASKAKAKVKEPKAAVLDVGTSVFSQHINPKKKRGKIILAVLEDFKSGKLLKAGDKGISYDIPKITGEKYMDLRVGNIIVKHFKEAKLPDISTSITPEQKKDFNLKSKKLGAIGFTVVLVKK